MTQQEKRNKAKKRLIFRKAKRYTKASCFTTGRLVLFALMLVLVLFCTAWIFFLRTFNAQHINEVITTQLQHWLDRPVKISSLELKFINTVELKGFYILDTTGDPGQAFVSADSVTLHFSLLSLLENKLVIHEVALNSPRFNLVRRKDGQYNIPQMHISNLESSSYTNIGGRKFALQIKDWSIKNGVFHFQDQISGASHSLYGFNAHFDNLQFDNFAPFQLEMVLRNQWQGRISELEIDLDGEVNLADLDWSKFMLRGVKARVSLFDEPLEITLDLENLINPSFTLGMKAPAFEAKDLSQFGLSDASFEVPSSTVTASGNLSNNYTQLAISQLSAIAGDIQLTASGQADFAKNPLSVRANFSTDWFALRGKEKMVSFLKKYGLSGRAKATGTVTCTGTKWDVPVLTVQAEGVSGDFYGFQTEKVNGEFRAKTHFTDLYARTTSGKLTVANSVFDHLKLSASWRKGTLYASIEGAELNSVPMKLDVNIADLKKDNRHIHTRMYFQNFDPMSFIGTVQDFVTVITPLTGRGSSTPEVTGELAWLRNFRDRLPNFMPNFSGSLAADAFTSGVLTGAQFNAAFDFTGMTAGAKNLTGPLQLRLQRGTILQMEKWAEEQEALNVTFQPFIMMHRMERAGSFSVGKVLRDVEVEELGVSATFTNGQMQVNNAYTVGPVISASLSGWVDWVNEQLDTTIYTMFTNTSKSGVLAENLTDESGNPALAFRLSSAMSKPKLEMLRAKKAGQTIRAAQAAGVGTNFEESEKFIQGEYHATK